MTKEISPEEIRELLSYMEKIKNFEKRYKLQIIAVERIIWGLLLIIAGLLDFTFAAYIFQYGPVFIPWVLIIPVGLLMTNFLSNQTKIIEESEEDKIPFYKQPINIAFILIVISIIAFSNEILYFLVMPSIAIIMGVALLLDRTFILPGKLRVIEYLTPVLIMLTAIVNILGYYFISNVTITFLVIANTGFSIFHGIIFGTVFGMMELIQAYLTRKQLKKN